MHFLSELWQQSPGSGRRWWPARWLLGALLLLLPGLAFARARPPAARPQQPADSLAQLLAYVRRADALQARHRPDSAARYLRRAWQLAGHRQGPQQSIPVIRLARELAGQHYARGNYDSSLYYYQRAARQFQAAGIDSTLGLTPATARHTDPYWKDRGLLAGILANAGATCRALGRLPPAMSYYERARRLYQQHGSLPGIGWTQCLLGQAYAAQGNYPQAERAYEQALTTYRRYGQQPGAQGPAGGALADVLLNYYLPLLLEGHSRHPAAYASTLAAEASDWLQSDKTPAILRATPGNALLLTHLNLVPAQAALQAGRPAAAATWLRRARAWLPYGASADTTVAGWPARDLPYAEARALTLGLSAWQQHRARPLRARRQLAQAEVLLTQNPRAALQPQKDLAEFALAWASQPWR